MLAEVSERASDIRGVKVADHTVEQVLSYDVAEGEGP